MEEGALFGVLGPAAHQHLGVRVTTTEVGRALLRRSSNDLGPALYILSLGLILPVASWVYWAKYTALVQDTHNDPLAP